MKKIITLLVIFSLALSLSACTLNLFGEYEISMKSVKETTEKATEKATKETTKKPTKETIENTPEVPTKAPVTTATADLSCRGITLDTDMVILDKAGNAHLLSYKLQPENTTDKVTFTSENPQIATVNEKGNITAVAEGETKIIIKCGKAEKVCAVYCQFEKETIAPTTITPTAPQQGTIRLNRKDITFTCKGESWELYSGDIAKNLVTFTSDDETVATFANGKIVAVGRGMTTVYASCGDQKVSCLVRCAFQESTGVDGNGGVSEDGGVPVNLTGKIVNVQVDLNVRSGAGTEYEKLGVLPLGEQITITQIKNGSDGRQWGKTSAGWVPMDYVQLDSN